MRRDLLFKRVIRPAITAAGLPKGLRLSVATDRTPSHSLPSSSAIWDVYALG